MLDPFENDMTLCAYPLQTPHHIPYNSETNGAGDSSIEGPTADLHRLIIGAHAVVIAGIVGTPISLSSRSVSRLFRML